MNTKAAMVTMKMLSVARATAIMLAWSCVHDIAHAEDIPPAQLRLGYLASNPAQGFKDPATGELRGVVPDIHAELIRRTSPGTMLVGLQSPSAVIEAVRAGNIDLGFVAPNSERMTGVAYSSPYMVVRQTFLVADRSRIKSVEEVGQSSMPIGANVGDSAALYVKSHLPGTELFESPDMTMQEPARWLTDGKVMAFVGNRQRLSVAAGRYPGLRVLPDDLYSVPQAIAVASDRTALLAWIDSVIDQLRSSGYLERAMQRSGVAGIAVAPASPASPALPELPR